MGDSDSFHFQVTMKVIEIVGIVLSIAIHFEKKKSHGEYTLLKK